MSNSTGFLPNISTLYKNHGGFKSLIRSAYFWISLFVTALCWRFVPGESWPDLAKDILPQLAGFSVAAYALFFAVLDERSRKALREPAEQLGGRSPLLILASSISHAVIVQIVAVLVALVYLSKPLLTCSDDLAVVVNYSFGSLGLFLLIYGVTLVLAAVLSIFKILEIEARVAS
ncbi:hypothetical protein O3U67_11485 [Brevundimonas diminuta]|uniref:hypothetical protein n=1 Tax=Brevundimonas diminuta TaxID=293 RepID=UPI0022B01D68|nr:hypothetical protein [Brevundimonas diminuta]MCZ4108706.1 hypothetical protein [Brevundimonas diminuta]